MLVPVVISFYLFKQSYHLFSSHAEGKMVKMANDIINVVLDIQPQPHKYSEEVASRFGEDVEVFIKELQSSSSIEPTGTIYWFQMPIPPS
jgi:hypothetical protein